MELPPLVNGHILKRYKRFLADVVLDNGEQVVAHVPNTGRMTGCWAQGAPVQLSHNSNPKRKLAWTLERVDMGNGWVGVNTQRSNPVIEEALRQRQIPGLESYETIRREVIPPLQNSRSRLDFCLTQPGLTNVWIEVKNVTLWEQDCLCFPDAPSRRGRQHLRDLDALSRTGQRSIILYALNRPEGNCFRPADHIDPDYGQLLREVIRCGVEIMAIRLRHTSTGIDVTAPLRVDLAEKVALV
jgi:sugar fermentation stimulation protein A